MEDLATLAVPDAPDVLKELPLTVLSTSESYASWAESAPNLDSHGLCEMEFRLPGRSIRVGERLGGTLVITPSQDFRARSLLVELAHGEEVTSESGKLSKTVVASEVVYESPRYETGLVREYVFAMDMPGSAGPCLKTDQIHVAWRLRAVAKRRIRFDPELQLLLNVYNCPKTAEG